MRYIRAVFVFLVVSVFGSLVAIAAGVQWGSTNCGALVAVTGLAAFSYSAAEIRKRK